MNHTHKDGRTSFLSEQSKLKKKTIHNKSSEQEILTKYTTTT